MLAAMVLMCYLLLKSPHSETLVKGAASQITERCKKNSTFSYKSEKMVPMAKNKTPSDSSYFQSQTP